MDVGFAVPNLTVWNITLSEHNRTDTYFINSIHKCLKDAEDKSRICMKKSPYKTVTISEKQKGMHNLETGQCADKPIHRLDNSWTGQFMFTTNATANWK